MNNTLYITFFISTLFANAQEIIGKWSTFDDATNEKKAIVEIYQRDDAYYGKIVRSFTSEPGKLCDKCPDDQKNKPIVGLVIIQDLKKRDTQYEDGTILDPENGKVYSCYLELIEKDKLKVRGFLGFSLLGRTQYWQRVH